MKDKQIELERLLNDNMIDVNVGTMMIANLFGIEFFDSNKKHGWFITKPVNDTNTSDEECTLHDVSKQRELLIASLEKIRNNDKYWYVYQTDIIVDNILSNL